MRGVDRFVVRLKQLEHARQVVVVGHGVDGDPRGAGACRLRATTTGDGHDPYLVPVEQVDRCLVEPRRVERDQRGVRLAGTAGREEVVDVDTALEDHESGPAGHELQHRRLPRGAGGGDEDDDHTQLRPTTVSAGLSVEASNRKNR